MEIRTRLHCTRCGWDWIFVADHKWVFARESINPGCPQCGQVKDLDMDRFVLRMGEYERLLHESIWGKGVIVCGPSN